MAADRSDADYLTIAQACAYLGVEQPALRRVLRRHGLSDLLRASMRREVLISRRDLDGLRPALARQARPGLPRAG